MDAALYEIFEENGTPEKIHADRESALIHSKFLKENNVEVYHTNGSDHNQSGSSPISERVIRTIRGKLEMLRDVSTARSWKQHVQQVTDEYNNSVH